MKVTFHETASLAETQDRARFLIGAHPKDSDEDLSEEEGKDSFSDQIRKSNDGEGDEDLDVDKEILDELDKGDEDEKKNDDTDERDEDLNEEELTYKQRFADTKSDRDEQARRVRELMQENARLKAVQTADSEINEEQLAREVQEGIFAEVSKITETDPSKRTKAAYDIVGKYIATSTKKAVELALKQMNVQRDKETTESVQRSQKREAATKHAKIALREIGLDPEKTISIFQQEVDKQMEREPEWFEAIPPSEHFVRLATRVKERLDKTRKAKDEHRREADGQINSGSRGRRPTTDKDPSDNNGELDTMRGAMGLASRAAHLRGRRAFQLANVQR